ncbi:CaiB/BaiF CoA transferase family protein [Streptomyces acidiscabies]|uniref:CaiB/BaiF CoA-transferase family protein n=1 Tax=Streptomyces acidiscabies TaxID=42234 RepID=A0AAP6BBA1_9ACTN|nr:CaiB/BaiF CoA-transferase family protein [Streptomyces acidiscabies]MDX2961465.1 CaiB/BaiF CoA-transferase family protein [Streptomyces acidiscabies]MDX3023253.1 CaiB/BaiF CoA-transferase family protein [Streptomyces acidiscabies]MDX3792187.1 CaiB/BaiF CoA-transferase family protein [Streptomyces acidiscabies]
MTVTGSTPPEDEHRSTRSTRRRGSGPGSGGSGCVFLDHESSAAGDGDGIRMTADTAEGPLRHISVLELAAAHRIVDRGKRLIAVDLRHAEGRALLLDLVSSADVLVEGFRPGVMERLGLGPQPCLERRPRLVYARLTGFGRAGPWSERPGHDLGFCALSGALALTGPADGAPLPAANAVADMGGGGLMLAMGVIAALLEAERGGAGQVVDTSMVAGAASLLSIVLGLRASGLWSDRRGTNLLDGGAPYYATYRCSDERYVAVAALEEPFYRALVEALGIDSRALAWRDDPGQWPLLRRLLATAFARRPRDDWAAELPPDACVVPVLELGEAVSGSAYTVHAGIPQPVPGPHFGRTPAGISRPAPEAGQHTAEVLASYGVPQTRVETLAAQGVICRERQAAS